MVFLRLPAQSVQHQILKLLCRSHLSGAGGNQMATQHLVRLPDHKQSCEKVVDGPQQETCRCLHSRKDETYCSVRLWQSLAARYCCISIGTRQELDRMPATTSG